MGDDRLSLPIGIDFATVSLADSEMTRTINVVLDMTIHTPTAWDGRRP